MLYRIGPAFAFIELEHGIEIISISTQRPGCGSRQVWSQFGLLIEQSAIGAPALQARSPTRVSRDSGVRVVGRRGRVAAAPICVALGFGGSRRSARRPEGGTLSHKGAARFGRRRPSPRPLRGRALPLMMWHVSLHSSVGARFRGLEALEVGGGEAGCGGAAVLAANALEMVARSVGLAELVVDDAELVERVGDLVMLGPALEDLYEGSP